jgi:hypothetical protein
LNQLNNQLEEILRAPPGIVNPLPEEDQLALPVIFFMLMPVEIEQFGRYCLISQEMLVPRTPLHPNSDKNNTTFGQPIKETEYTNAFWSYHYNNYGGGTSTSFIDANFSIIPTTQINVPMQIGPGSVDNILSKAQYCGNFHSNSVYIK